MAKVKAYYDTDGNTLTVWFGEPQTEFICDEAADGVILMKNSSGKVIGFEKLNYAVSNADKKILFETAVV